MDLNLVNGTFQSDFEFNHVVGYEKYRIFSNNETGSTGGRIVVYVSGEIWHAWEGSPDNHIGEHVWIGEDRLLDHKR